MSSLKWTFLEIICIFLLVDSSFGRQRKSVFDFDFNFSYKVLYFLKKYSKLTKISCNTSNKTCINMKCSLKAESKHENVGTIKCDLKTPLSFFLV